MNYTCVTCSLQFESPNDQRTHMKSEWHRYNLKRRVAQLPSVDEETFTSKISALSIESNEPKEVSKKEQRRQQREILAAKKRELLAARELLLLRVQNSEKSEDPESVKSENLENSKNSENSQNSSASTSTETSAVALTATENLDVTPTDTPSEDSITQDLIEEKIANGEQIPITTCLFCPSKQKTLFESVDENILHMFKFHGLYIPERKYLVDQDGLIGYLGEKIGLGNVCLACNYQGRNLEAVRSHMLRKRHARIPYESEDEKLEISDYYDFSSTYENVNGSALISEDGGEWEDVSDEEASNGNGDSNDNSNDSNDDEDYEEDEYARANSALVSTGTELVLPSGSVIGHRSMARYYKQYVAPEKVLSEGHGTVVAAETRHFMGIANKQIAATTKRAWGHAKHREDTNDRRAAKFINNQPHFRDPLLQ